MRTGFLGVVALGLVTAACGTTQQQRSATGGLTGLGAGAIIGGPVGAVVGTVVGAAGGAILPEDATTIANNMLGRAHRAGNAALNRPSPGAERTVSAGTARSGSTMPPGLVKEAQSQLKDQGLYPGAVDGIVGPKTRSALKAYQEKEGLRPTARLDRATVARMNIAETTARPMPQGSPAPAASPPNAAPPPPPTAAPAPAPPDDNTGRQQQ
jgi:hypothetical protein